MTTIIKDAFAAYANSQTKTWGHDRSLTIGASEIGQCARKVWYGKKQPDARDEGYTDSFGARMRGSIMEEKLWVPALRKRFGRKLKFAGRSQQTLIDGYLSATPDSIVTGLQPGELGFDHGDCIVIEAKTIDPRATLEKAKAENVFQTHVQMGIIASNTDYKPTHAIISYTDASFWNEVTEFIVTFDPAIYESAKARAGTIMSAGAATELRPEGYIAGGRECDYCPFTKACGQQRRAVPQQDQAELDPQLVAELEHHASRIRMFEAERDDAEVKIRSEQEALKDRMREKGVRSVKGQRFNISWSAVKGRAGWDNTAIRQAAIDAGIDVQQFATMGEPNDRLTIRANTGQ